MISSFDVQSARIHAQQSDLETWVHTYLVAGPWANHGLSDGLKKERRWWRGPFEVPLEAVTRCCGSEPEMEFHIDPAWWEKRIMDLSASFSKLENIPPLIVEYRAGLLSIRDGNHRHEAMRRKGWQTAGSSSGTTARQNMKLMQNAGKKWSRNDHPSSGYIHSPHLDASSGCGRSTQRRGLYQLAAPACAAGDSDRTRLDR